MAQIFYFHNFEDYEHLKPFNKNTNFLDLMRNTLNAFIDCNFEKDYRLNFLILRRLNKYNKYFFNSFFGNLIEIIAEIIENINYNEELKILSILLAKEVFLEFDYEDKYLPNWIRILLPSIIKEVFSENDLISNVAKSAMKSVEENMLYGTTIETLLNFIYNKDINLSNFCFECLDKLLSYFESVNIEIIIQFIGWETFLYSLINLFLHKNFTIKGIYIYNKIIQIIGKETLDRELSYIDNLDLHINLEKMISTINK